MAYTVKISDKLLPKCAYIRKAVFMEEQGFQQEFDEIDDRAYHALILDGETPAAVGRLYTKDGKHTSSDGSPLCRRIGESIWANVW